jgi:hypothetical protein
MILLSGTAFASEPPSAKSDNPFLLPQLGIVIGNLHNTIHLSNDLGRSTSNLNGGGINTYGFDLEVNYSKFMNIGAYFRVESQGEDPIQIVNKQFATLIGGFTRFFYVPPFLKGKTLITNVFTRLELGGGPTFYQGMMPSGGLLGQTGIHIGFETYFNRWIGASVSVGQIFEFGRETLVTGDNGTSSLFTAPYRNATLWNEGRIFQFSLKTTFF